MAEFQQVDPDAQDQDTTGSVDRVQYRRFGQKQQVRGQQGDAALNQQYRQGRKQYAYPQRRCQRDGGHAVQQRLEKQKAVIAHGAVADAADESHGAGEIQQGGSDETFGEVAGADPEAPLQPVAQPVQALFDIQQLAEDTAQQQAADGLQQAWSVGQGHTQTDDHGRQPQTLHQGGFQAGRQPGTDGQADGAADDDGGGIDEGAEQGESSN